MSLLLEALKKAELAKQVAKGEAPSPEPKPGSPEPTKPVMTREKLPDITQSLEILSDDLPSSETKAAEPAAARPEFSLQEQETSEPAAQPILSTNESARTAERAQAQQLFQVKEMDYNPRRPFHLTLGALVIAGVAQSDQDERAQGETKRPTRVVVDLVHVKTLLSLCAPSSTCGCVGRNDRLRSWLGRR